MYLKKISFCNCINTYNFLLIYVDMHSLFYAKSLLKCDLVVNKILSVNSVCQWMKRHFWSWPYCLHSAEGILMSCGFLTSYIPPVCLSLWKLQGLKEEEPIKTNSQLPQPQNVFLFSSSLRVYTRCPFFSLYYSLMILFRDF